MSDPITYEIPANLIPSIKEGLVTLGYATQDTPDEFVQDAYFKYVMVRQTGFNPNLPYALELLPKEIQDQLGGSVSPATPMLSGSINVQGSMVYLNTKVSYTDPATKPAALNARIYDESTDIMSSMILNPLSDTEYELVVVNVPAGSYTLELIASNSTGELTSQSTQHPVTINAFTPQPFDVLDVDSVGMIVSPIPHGGAYWSTSTGQAGTIVEGDGTGSVTFSPALESGTWINIETLDETRKQQIQYVA